MPSGAFSEPACYICFLFMILPVIFFIIYFMQENRNVFHILLFLTGVFTFTFFEYIAHRFWMHSKENKHPGNSLQRHLDHHRHPTEIKITVAQRVILVGIQLTLIFISVWMDNYFTFFAGFFSGFVYYSFMHFILHQAWAGKLFRRLQIAHICHHCRFPDRCFGISTIWWDRLFQTDAPAAASISPRILDFYFRKSG